MDTDILEIKQIIKELALSQKETDKRIKAAFDLFEGQWGKLMESLVEGDLIHLLNAWGIKISKTSMRRKGTHNGQNFEYDIIAHNGGEIVYAENEKLFVIKATGNSDHVIIKVGFIPKGF